MRLNEQLEAVEHKAGHLSDARVGARLPSSFAREQRGFTLTELITIIVILGIISVTAIPRFFDRDAFDSLAAADQIKAALRYAQKAAIAQHAIVTISVSKVAPGESSNCGGEVTGGVVACAITDSVTVNKALPWVSTFDAMGRPGGGDSIMVGTTTITIEAETGYVH